MVRSRSFIATPPGATIKEQLNDREMSQKEFAARMDMSEKHISKLINGEVQLTPEVAVRLEVVLGVPAKFWNNLEAIYREKLIKVKAENAMEADEALAKQLPYNEMAKFGWVPEARDSKEKVINLRKYFEVVELSLLENTQITRIACRRLAVTEKGDFALMAWAQKAKLEARNIQTAPINIKGLINAIPKIREMTVMKPKDFCPKIKSVLADCGIALIFLPHLKGSFLQGASFMDGGKIVVGLTARGKDADKFWFSLFHELAHIILGHIGQVNGTTEDDELGADAWARDTLIPMEVFDDFRDKSNYSATSICKFAKQQGIAPGIVVGRLQNEGCIKHSMLNDLKEHYEIAI
ncbi:HigA family addiction module antitoxin [Agathobacter ruminis]|uniref:Addiction module antidote protein, HigA family n=1 Tax=Agathobacter ruminis TaxID=1712665 RepID=A0A2G3E380_9FIRM|nr:HigA family addiction module antitoxin [Agathobacter ruminis]MDC7301549.1 HigA family addiction module antitoxin [Agathobacter ruminis]PHU37736.1 addiction module antidote protein, HigA family [Agathobacter ruminis]